MGTPSGSNIDRVYDALNELGGVDVTSAQIAEQTDMHTTSVGRALKALIDMEMVSRYYRKQPFAAGKPPYVYSAVGADSQARPEPTERPTRKTRRHRPGVARDRIVNFLSKRRVGRYTFTVAELASKFGTSGETARKIVLELEQQGLVQQHGHKNQHRLFIVSRSFDSVADQEMPIAVLENSTIVHVRELRSREVALEQLIEETATELSTVRMELDEIRSLLGVN